MAKLNQDGSAISFAAAVTAMSLGTGKRLIRNFSYYKQTTSEIVFRQDCIDICKEMRFNTFSLQNLYLDEDHSESRGSFKVLLAKQIQDNLEELHRKLLFFEPNDIVGLIPQVDSLRSFWSRSSDSHFYGDNLSQRIDDRIIPLISELQSQIEELPGQTTG